MILEGIHFFEWGIDRGDPILVEGWPCASSIGAPAAQLLWQSRCRWLKKWQ